jgi:hypothetical protein
MGDKSFVTIDGKSAQPILDMTAGVTITVPAGESIIIRDGEGNTILHETGPTTVTGPLTLNGNPA